jgi:hypothetical protein
LITIIAGTREISDYNLLEYAIEQSGFTITQVVSGRARGPDQMGETWAAKNDVLPIKMFAADWEKYGLSAGPIRNQQMAEYSQQLLALWDGQSTGTKDMIERAVVEGLTVFVLLVESPVKQLLPMPDKVKYMPYPDSCNRHRRYTK